MVGLIFGILLYVKKKTHTNKQKMAKKWKNEKKKKKKRLLGVEPCTYSVLGSLLNDCATSQSDKFG